MNKDCNMLLIIIIITFLIDVPLRAQHSSDLDVTDEVNKLMQTETYSEAVNLLDRWAAYPSKKIRKIIVILVDKSNEKQDIKPIDFQGKAFRIQQVEDEQERYELLTGRKTKNDMDMLFFDIQTLTGRCAWAITKILSLNQKYFFWRVNSVSELGIAIIPLLQLPKSAQIERVGTVEFYKEYNGGEKITRLINLESYKQATELIEEWKKSLNEHEMRNLLVHFAKQSKNKNTVKPIVKGKVQSSFDLNTLSGRFGWAISRLFNLDKKKIKRKFRSKSYSFITGLISTMRLPASVHFQNKGVEARKDLAESNQIMMLSENILHNLKRDNSLKVRRVLASNPNTPLSIINELTKDKNYEVTKKAKHNVLHTRSVDTLYDKVIMKGSK